MTFGYVGYVWAILGCSSVALFLIAIGAALYFVGKRAERRAPRTVVEALPVAVATSVGAAAPAAGDASLPPGDRA